MDKMPLSYRFRVGGVGRLPRVVIVVPIVQGVFGRISALSVRQGRVGASAAGRG